MFAFLFAVFPFGTAGGWLQHVDFLSLSLCDVSHWRLRIPMSLLAPDGSREVFNYACSYLSLS